MTSPKMWIVLSAFLETYKNLALIPYTVDIKKKQIAVIKLPFIKRLILHILPVYTTFFTHVNLKPLFFKLRNKNNSPNGTMEVFKTSLHLIHFLLPAAFLVMSYVISFRVQVAPFVLNEIVKLQVTLQGEFS
jgi:hypothetical protein